MLEALVAGVIQGLTEFIPVSSSGHLVVFQYLFGEGDGPNLAFNVFLHLATLVSVFVVFYKDIWALIREFFSLAADIVKGKPDFKSPSRRFLLMVIVGIIPAILAGALIKILGVSYILENIFVVAIMFLLTAALMLTIDRIKAKGYTESDAPIKTAVITGVLQAAAILPGLSRSGSTIFGGRLSGLTKEFAIKFAFILSIPAILGAGLVELPAVIRGGAIEIDALSWIVGFFAAALCGIAAINFIKLLAKVNKMYIFGIYCLAASLFTFLAGFGIISF